MGNRDQLVMLRVGDGLELGSGNGDTKSQEMSGRGEFQCCGQGQRLMEYIYLETLTPLYSTIVMVRVSHLPFLT